MKWVEMKMVTLSRRASSTISRQKLSRAIGSTPEVGSSRISSSGWCTMATASDRRWRMPSGNCMGSVLRAACRSKRSSMVCTRWGTSASGTWNRRACSTRFCSTDNSLYSENACDI